MLALPLLFGWLVLAADPSPSPSQAQAAYTPPGKAVELYELGRAALLRDPRAHLIGFNQSSPHRENGDETVLADAKGPGIIQRLWFEAPNSKDATSRETGRLVIRLDNASNAVLDIPLAELFAGKNPRLPGTLMSRTTGGFTGYVPIPFQNGCVVSFRGTLPPHYAISIVSLPGTEGLTTFRADINAEEAKELELARALWQEPEALFENVPPYSPQRNWRLLSIRKQVEEAEYPVDGSEQSTHLFALPAGPRTIRSLDAIIDPKTTENWRTARLRIVWDGDDIAHPDIDLPVSEFFEQAVHSFPYRSLMAGANENVWSNRLPMPYREGGSLQIDARGPIKGAIRVRTVRGAELGAGELRALGRSVTSNAAGRPAEWASVQGRGHLVGTFLTAHGRGNRAAWLKQSLTITSDGETSVPAGTALAHEFNVAQPDVAGGFDRAAVTPLSGFPVFRREGDEWSLAAYRWRVSDPVPFRESLALRVEPDDVHALADAVRVVMFWYSERPGPVRAGR